MVDLVRRVARAATIAFGLGRREASRPLLHTPENTPKVLVVGVYLSQKENLVEHLVANLGASKHCAVTQRWVSIGPASTNPAVVACTVSEVLVRTPKFTLINQFVTREDVEDYDFIMVCDDDVSVPPDFIDRFIGWQQHCAFALAQPARTWTSYVDHPFVRKQTFCKARETRFVEIGPIFCASRSMARLILPFDEASAMGWGYDLVWPSIARNHGLRLGIVDDAAIDHSIRARSQHYSTAPELESMANFLATREHVQASEAFVNLQKYR